MTIHPSSPTQKNPIEILQEQVIRLNDICRIQQEQVDLLRAQNQQITQALQTITKSTEAKWLLHVKVEDIDVPFGNLVGFLLKMTFAWIPVTIVLGIIYLFVLSLFGSLF